MNYNYWDRFINYWQNLAHRPVNIYLSVPPPINHRNFLGWTNPNINPLLNKPGQQQFSLEYLPEPWWGNNGNAPLHSVVINYNPGWAETYKHYSHPSVTILYNNPLYSDFAHSQAIAVPNIFTRTNRWHFKQRAKKVFETLTRRGVNLNGNNTLNNHLSIELIPWHTTNITDIHSYINCNLQPIYSNCLKFAAHQSRRIENDLLKNKVILRCGGTTTKDLLNNLDTEGIDNYNIINDIGYAPAGAPLRANGSRVTGNGGYLKFSFNSIQDVEFISIWGKHSRNGFPPSGDMDWIFDHII
jgi:hypothetical protein